MLSFTSEGEKRQIQIKNSIGIDLDMSSADKRSVRRIGDHNGGRGLESVDSMSYAISDIESANRH